MTKELTVDVHGERGFAFSFPYDPTMVNLIKLELPGVHWDKVKKVWYTTGPEVMLDCRRGNYSLKYTPQALERARDFRVFIDKLLDVRYQKLNGAGEYAFQDIGVEVMRLQERGILGDDVGLGKTRQALLAYKATGVKNVLIVVENSLLYNWEPEVKKWLPEEPVSVLPDAPAKRKKFWEQWDGSGAVIVNYEKLTLKDWPMDLEWGCVIADEATYIKTPTAKRTKAFWQVAGGVRYVWLLTGTPLEMNVQELYTLMSGLRPTVFGPFVRFRDNHLITDFFGSVIGVRNQALLSERAAPWMLRRTKQDVKLQIPPMLHNDVWVELSGTEQSIYNRLRTEFEGWLEEQGRDSAEANALTQLLRLQQFTSDPRLVDEDGPGSKLEMLSKIIDGWAGQALVFTRFSKMIPLIVSQLCSDPDATIYGDVSPKERVARVNAFNAGDLGQALVCTDAANHGLNITGADLVIHYDLLFNPSRMKQRTGRIDRIGQQALATNVIRLMCVKTVDEGMKHVLEERQELFDSVMDGAEQAILKGLNLKRIASGQKG